MKDQQKSLSCNIIRHVRSWERVAKISCGIFIFESLELSSSFHHIFSYQFKNNCLPGKRILPLSKDLVYLTATIIGYLLFYICGIIMLLLICHSLLYNLPDRQTVHFLYRRRQSRFYHCHC
ncbi:Uncharacterized protein TCM_033859 [Theobroma cacao]|uniref:Uncharacterized protein n=1 Tax=Theobroma cacao TaxID=3641 RepID=A0A061FJ16_THECC|nr:Uncharacterized protein TCM_033859 [Theobroma cacao]